MWGQVYLATFIILVKSARQIASTLQTMRYFSFALTLGRSGAILAQTALDVAQAHAVADKMSVRSTTARIEADTLQADWLEVG